MHVVIADAGGDGGQQLVGQIALEADDEDVVYPVNLDVALTDRPQALQRRLHLCGRGGDTQRAGGGTVEAQRERPLAGARKRVVDEHGLDRVGDRRPEAAQGRARQGRPGVDGVRRADDVERIRPGLQQVAAAGAEDVHRRLGEGAGLGEADDDAVAEARHLEVGGGQSNKVDERLLDRRGGGVVRQRRRLEPGGRLHVGVDDRPLEAEREGAAAGVDDDLLLIRRPLGDELATRSQYVQFAADRGAGGGRGLVSGDGDQCRNARQRAPIRGRLADGDDIVARAADDGRRTGSRPHLYLIVA